MIMFPAKSKIRKARAIFLDRDGVINKEIGQLSDIKDFLLYSFSARAIKKINQSGYLAVIITNQPMIAKGFMTKNGLRAIHQKMETELGFQDAKIDAIYYCPHHPERGFPGEVKKLKIKCKCRKPEIGMIKKAVKDFNIDLKRSFFIGDASVDIKTAKNAGIRFIGVKTGYACKDGKYPIDEKILLYSNLLKAVEGIINRSVAK